MAIINIKRDWGVDPAIVRINATNTLAQVGTDGYLVTEADNILALNAGPFEWYVSDMVLVYASDGWGFFTVDPNFEDLNAFVFVPGVTGATVVGNFANFDSVGGNLTDLGFEPSDPAQTVVVMADGATTVDALAVFADTAGTVKDADGATTLAQQLTVAAPIISSTGNITSGASGNAGSFISFPATAANGTLILEALNAGGAFNTTIRNSVMGQSTVYSIPDIGAATGGIPVSTGAISMKMVADAAAAGGSATQNFVDAFCTAASVVLGFWQTQANPATILTIVPGVGSFDVVSDVDAGAGTFNYVILK
jgi:hypothetical protein